MNTHIWRAGRGTRILLGRHGRWITAEGFRPGMTRILGTGSAVFFVGGILLAAPILWWIAVPAWLATAWCAARHLTPTAPGHPEPAPEPQETLTFEQATTVLLYRLRMLIGPANGVHLDTLLTELVDDAQLPAGTTVADLRRDLTARNIPTRSSLKVGGAVRVGVHRDDLPAAEQPLPEHALTDAG